MICFCTVHIQDIAYIHCFLSMTACGRWAEIGTTCIGRREERYSEASGQWDDGQSLDAASCDTCPVHRNSRCSSFSKGSPIWRRLDEVAKAAAAKESEANAELQRLKELLKCKFVKHRFWATNEWNADSEEGAENLSRFWTRSPSGRL